MAVLHRCTDLCWHNCNTIDVAREVTHTDLCIKESARRASGGSWRGAARTAVKERGACTIEWVGLHTKCSNSFAEAAFIRAAVDVGTLWCSLHRSCRHCKSAGAVGAAAAVTNVNHPLFIVIQRLRHCYCSTNCSSERRNACRIEPSPEFTLSCSHSRCSFRSEWLFVAV